MPVPRADIAIVAEAVEVLRVALEKFLQGRDVTVNYVDMMMIGHNMHKLVLMHVLDAKPTLKPGQAASVIKMAEQTWTRTTAELILKVLGRMTDPERVEAEHTPSEG